LIGDLFDFAYKANTKHQDISGASSGSDAEGSQLDVYARGLSLSVGADGRLCRHHLPFPSAYRVALDLGVVFPAGLARRAFYQRTGNTTFMATDLKPRSNRDSSDYHTPRTVEEVN
jgi:hypothetical protein